MKNIFFIFLIFPFYAIAQNVNVVSNIGVMKVAPGASDSTKNNSDSIAAHNIRIGAVTESNATKAPIASPTFTGTVGFPTPFDLGGVSVTTTAARLNYLSSATGTTGTNSTNLVFSASPTFTGTITASVISASSTITGAGITSSNAMTIQAGALTLSRSNTLSTANGVVVGGTYGAITSGTYYGVQSNNTVAPTGGTLTHAGFAYTGTINQTGGSSGKTWGLYINPTITAAADFSAIEVTVGKIVFSNTVTAGGTTGARTINKISGKVNFAAGASTLVVTNNLVTANSVVIPTVEGTDATAISVRVTTAAGSFTLTLNQPATAETRVSFLVLNN